MSNQEHKQLLSELVDYHKKMKDLQLPGHDIYNPEAAKPLDVDDLRWLVSAARNYLDDNRLPHQPAES